MFKYCPYEKVRSPFQARAAVAQGLVWSSLLLCISPRLYLVCWIGLFQQGLGGKGTCHTYQMRLAQ